MSTQINKSNLLVELSTEKQQIISGGRCHCSPYYKPRKYCGGYGGYRGHGGYGGYDNYKYDRPYSYSDNYPGFDNYGGF